MLHYFYEFGGGGIVSSPGLYITENIKRIIADATKITNIEYSDFHAIFFTSMISQIPKIAKTAKNRVKIANSTEMPFLNIILSFYCLIKYTDKVAKWLILNVKDC